MEPPVEPQTADDKPRWNERIVAFLEVVAAAALGAPLAQLSLIVAGFQVADVFQDSTPLFILLASDSVFTLLLIVVFLKARGESWRALSPKPRRLGRESLIGLAGLPAAFALLVAATVFFTIFLPEWVTETNPVLELIRTPRDVVLFLITSLFVGGIKEEVQRAFILERFERFLGGAALGLFLWSLLFGLGHLAQGPDNAVKAAGLGLLFGLLYLWRRNLAAPVVCHAAYDVAAVLAFWFFLRQ